MPPNRWALLDIQQEEIEGGFTITVTTDIACHLFMYHTLKKPWSHPKPVLRRGLLMQYDARFCFVAYTHLEQNEPGDTIVHTFTWLGWLFCQTRYFYFWATIAWLVSPSNSPIFSKHYVGPPPLILQESHVSPLLGGYGGVRDYRLAQSFTPQANYAIKQLSIKMRGNLYGDGGTWHAQIRTNDDWHPSEVVLWEGTLPVASFPYPDYAWFDLAVSGVDAETDIPLWIVGFRTDYLYWFDYPASASDIGDLYARGEALFQGGPGQAWSGHDMGHDLGFKIWSI